MTSQDARSRSSAVDPLVAAGMRYGMLVRIDSDYQAARYNRVLQEFGLPPVAQSPFHVDIAGFSVEVAAALGDMDYLDPNGANRRFVVLTNRQAQAPLVHSNFSCEKALLQRFFAANEAVIAKITLHNVLYGEIENYAYRFETPADVMQLRSVDFDCHSLDGYFERQTRLRDMVRRFEDVSDLSVRHDPATIAQMIDLARTLGDVRSDGGELRDLRQSWPEAFSTRLFGGATFLDVAAGNGSVIGDVAMLTPSSENLVVVDHASPAEVLAHLRSRQHLDPISIAWLRESKFLAHRLRSLAGELLLAADPDADGLALATERGIDNAIREHIEVLCKDPRFGFLARLRRLAEHDEAAAYDTVLCAKPALQALVARAVPGRVATAEVNRLLAHMCDFDPVTLFALDKGAFYRRHAETAANRKVHMLALVENFYMPAANDPDRKTRLKARFFG